MIPRFVIIPAVILLASAGTAVVRTAPQQPAAQDNNAAVMSKNVEVMRRILDREIREGKATRETTSFIWAGGGNSEAWYVPGNGFLYVGSVNMALVGPSKEEAAEEKKESSLWDEVQAEVDGRAEFRGGMRVRTASRFDEKAVNALKERVLRAIGTYGTRIQLLEPDALITVVLRGASPVSIVRTADGRNPNENTSASDSKDTAMPPAEMAEAELAMFTLDSAFSGGSVMTFVAKASDCREYSGVPAKYDEFASKVKIASYSARTRHGASTYYNVTTGAGR